VIRCAQARVAYLSGPPGPKELLDAPSCICPFCARGSPGERRESQLCDGLILRFRGVSYPTAAPRSAHLSCHGNVVYDAKRPKTGQMDNRALVVAIKRSFRPRGGRGEVVPLSPCCDDLGAHQSLQSAKRLVHRTARYHTHAYLCLGGELSPLTGPDLLLCWGFPLTEFSRWLCVDRLKVYIN
jgi:hypothetical protein